MIRVEPTQLACLVVIVVLTTASALAQSPPPSTPAAQASSPPASANAPSLDQRLALLEERLNTALALKEERIQDIKDRIEAIYKLAAFLVAVLTVIFVVFSIRDVFLRSRERERQRSIDDVVKEMMRLRTLRWVSKLVWAQYKSGRPSRSPSNSDRSKTSVASSRPCRRRWRSGWNKSMRWAMLSTRSSRSRPTANEARN